MSTRKVTVVSTKNNKVKSYETDVTKWGELNELISNDFDLSNLKATENINKTTLEHIDSTLPEGDFRVFLRPTKTKSGNPDFSSMGFKDMRENYIKNDDEAKKFLAQGGRNWTQLGTEELRTGLTNYYASKSNSAVPVENAEVNEVQEQTFQQAAQDVNALDKFLLAKKLLQEVYDEVGDADMDDDTVEEVQERIDDFLTGDGDSVEETLKEYFTAGATNFVREETQQEKEARLQREDEEDALREAAEFESGFIK